MFSNVLRPILIIVHLIYLVGLVFLMLKEPDEYRAPALIPAVVLVLIVYGLVKAKRWIVVPSLILALVALMMAVMLMMGAVALPGSKINMYIFCCILFFILEIFVIWHAVRDYPAADPQSTPLK
jgi:hypothetical protein